MCWMNHMTSVARIVFGESNASLQTYGITHSPPILRQDYSPKTSPSSFSCTKKQPVNGAAPLRRKNLVVVIVTPGGTYVHMHDLHSSFKGIIYSKFGLKAYYISLSSILLYLYYIIVHV